MKALVAIILLLKLTPALANSDRYPATDSKSSRVQSIVPGSLGSLRQQVFRELVSADTPQLSWPPFPRNWIERTKTRILTSNTALGLEVPVIHSGAKVSVEFRYGLKTSLIIISSKRKTDPALNSEVNQLVDPREQGQILRVDPESHLTFPDVKEGVPMVGLCVFEASMAIEKGKTLKFEFMGSGQSLNHADVETMSNAVFSNFFQLRPDVSVTSYLEDICGDVFRKEVEQYVVDDFSKMVSEKLVQENPKSECKPTNSKDFDAAVGDPTCIDWHRTNYDRITRKMTLPRCELQIDGAHRCVLKSKERMPCPMYVNPRTEKYSDTYSRGLYSVRATKGYFENNCDTKLGFKCQMEKDPYLLLGVPFFFHGRASCQRAQ